VSYGTVLVERRQHVVCVTLNIPERRNPLTYQMVTELRDALGRSVDAGARTAIITGAGKGFCAGGDIGSMSSGFGGGGGPASARDGVLTFYKAAMGVAGLPIPVIAAINGAAVGAGLNLALACDIRIAASGAALAASFLRIGLPPGMGSSWLLTRLVGPAKAAELIFTAEPVCAEEAERIGLVNRVVPPESLVDEAWAMATKIAAGPPLQTRMSKQALRLALEHDHETLLQFEAMAQAVSSQTEDMREGLTAFLEKRRPEFKGR
jgi:2-(1,2-epoxy-1,2-dihydrophenyl)acetyl-CoA isomerase